MASRVSVFSSPLLLGFDQIERMIERAAKGGTDGYPPYNIEQIGEDALRITLAVAGFGTGDLVITVEDKQLIIRGKQADDKDRIYLHRGIAARQFQRSFVLADGIEVIGADLSNGLLHIDLQRRRPKPQVRSVPISSRAGSDGGAVGVDDQGNGRA